MIGFIRGIIWEKNPPFVLIDVAGIGYEVELSKLTIEKIELSKEVMVYTHLSIREDARLLYGFINRTERDMFRELIKINGVGPKMALSILSVLDTATLVKCVNTQDIGLLIQAPGVGKKIASRLLIDLQGRLNSWHGLTKSNKISTTDHQEVIDAINALVTLGYKKNEANQVIYTIENYNDLSKEQLIRKALSKMAVV